MTAKLPGMMNIREQWQADKDVDRLTMGQARELTNEIAAARRKAVEDEKRYVMIEKSLAAALGVRQPVRFVDAEDEGHRRGRWIDGGNDLRFEDCFCEIGKDHQDPNPWADA